MTAVTDTASAAERLAAKVDQIAKTEADRSRLTEQLDEARRTGADSRTLRDQIAETEEELVALGFQRDALEAEVAQRRQADDDAKLLAQVAAIYDGDVQFLRARLQVIEQERLLAAARERQATFGRSMTAAEIGPLDERLRAIDPALTVAQLSGLNNDGGQVFDVHHEHRLAQGRRTSAEGAQVRLHNAERRLEQAQAQVRRDVAQAVRETPPDGVETMRARAEAEGAPRIADAEEAVASARAAVEKAGDPPAVADGLTADQVEQGVLDMIRADISRLEAMATDLRVRAEAIA